jgi:hypothetical protein
MAAQELAASQIAGNPLVAKAGASRDPWNSPEESAAADVEAAAIKSLIERSRELEGAEDSTEIETDRDSFTPAAGPVDAGRCAIELAYSFIDNREVAETHSYPEWLLRYGVSERLEIRFGWNYETGGAASPISGNVPDGLGEEGQETETESRFLYGGKYQLTAQQNWMPTSSLILQGFTPTSGESNRSSISATHVFGWTLPNEWDLDFAVRYATGQNEDDSFNTWAPSTVIKLPLGERWKAHAEYFGVLSDGRETETVQHFFSPGAHYLITENLEIGARFGWGLNQQSPDFFVNAGIGWQF